MQTEIRADKLAALNSAQREAVIHEGGPALVLAGAGSGKTRVLTTRIARLVEENGVALHRILAVTFTNKAAAEMRSRLAKLLGAEPVGMWVGTFHAIGARFLRMHADHVGRSRDFTIYDEDDAQSLVKRLMERESVSSKDWSPQAILNAISGAKNALVTPTEYAALAKDTLARNVARIYAVLEPALRQANAVTFDDLLVLPVRIFQQEPVLLEKYRRRFQHVLVDEYQDTNRAQYTLITQLAGSDGNVMVVGDDDQSIYGWRGADIRNILDFERDFPNARVVRLEENYRSMPPVLALANAVIVPNKGRRGKTLRATRSGGPVPVLMRTLDERDEAEWLAEELVERRQSVPGARWSSCAVLYRTNAQSRALEEGLRRKSIPYRLVGAVRFYDRREIRDLMAYLKLAANPADDEAFRRAVAVPKRGVGDTSVEALAGAARSAGVPMLAAASDPASGSAVRPAVRPAARVALEEFVRVVNALRARALGGVTVDELLSELVTELGYEAYLRAEGPEGKDRIDNVKELITGATDFPAETEEGEEAQTPLGRFLQRATLVAATDQLDASADAVTLMTLHNAKGLEFPVVFITGLEDGLLPIKRALDEGGDAVEEERRLLYVGVTRAEDALYLSYAETRRWQGSTIQSKRSSFLDAVPPSLTQHRQTIRVRSSGRGMMGMMRTPAPSWLGGEDMSIGGPRAASRRPGMAIDFGRGGFADEDASQDSADIVVGARVKHRKFGSGTIAEVSGAGRESKAKVDFDDEAVGRKTLVVAQANLERVTE